jgi:hypothetical protein
MTMDFERTSSLQEELSIRFSQNIPDAISLFFVGIEGQRETHRESQFSLPVLEELRYKQKNSLSHRTKN